MAMCMCAIQQKLNAKHELEQKKKQTKKPK